jgi:hypothetical protein
LEVRELAEGLLAAMELALVGLLSRMCSNVLLQMGQLRELEWEVVIDERWREGQLFVLLPLSVVFVHGQPFFRGLLNRLPSSVVKKQPSG